MKRSARTAAGLCAVAALSSACTQSHASATDDSRLEKHFVGESVIVASDTSRATYSLSFPHLKDGKYTVNLGIDCFECTRWMPGSLVVVLRDGARVDAVGSTLDMTKDIAPLEVRKGAVSFEVDDPEQIDRIVLMRGQPVVAAAKWKVEDNGSLPTTTTAPIVQLASIGDGCKKPGSVGETESGEDAYCSRLDHTSTYLWSLYQGVIPNEQVQVKSDPAPAAVAPAAPRVQEAPVPAPAPAPAAPPPPIQLPPIQLPTIELPPWLK